MKVLATLNSKSTLIDGRIGPIMRAFDEEIDVLIENLKKDNSIVFKIGNKKLDVEFLEKIKATNTAAQNATDKVSAELNAKVESKEKEKQYNNNNGKYNNKNKNNTNQNNTNQNNNNTEEKPSVGTEVPDGENKPEN